METRFLERHFHTGAKLLTGGDVHQPHNQHDPPPQGKREGAIPSKSQSRPVEKRRRLSSQKLVYLFSESQSKKRSRLYYRNFVRMPPRIVYLDYAASAPLDPEVLEVMRPYLEAVGNPSSTHAAGRFLRTALEEARQTIADLLGAAPGEIVFTSGGTEADNHALRKAVDTFDISTILFNPTEHHAVLHTIEDLAHQGKIEAHPIAIDTYGRINLNHLEDLLKKHPKVLVSVMYANNEIGTLQPVREIAALCQQYGALYHCDTVQVMGLGWVRVDDWPVDFLAASAHKFYGPKGVGFIYRRRPIKSLITGGAQERGQRAGTENIASIVGMAFALQKAYKQKDAYLKHLSTLKAEALSLLQSLLPEARINGDPSPAGSHPGILNFYLPPEKADDLLLVHLDLAGVCASGTSACASGSGHPSHVLEALGLPAEAAMRAIRLSWGWGSKKTHLELAIQTLRQSLLSPTA
jgi:cysteine desulfurase